MSYRIVILPRAQKELAGIPAESQGRAKDSIIALSTDPRPKNSRKLVARDGWRIRVGDYRIIYEIDDSDKLVTVMHIGHRCDVYR